MADDVTRPARSAADASESVFSRREVAKFSALLWLLGAAAGLLGILLPHGPTVHVWGWAGVTVFAVLVALFNLWKFDLPLWVNYIYSVLALTAVCMALVFSGRSPVIFALCALYVLPTIFTASFYSRKMFLMYLVVQAAASAAVLFASEVPGAAAGWAVVTAATSAVGIIVHVLQEALKHAASTDPLTGLANRRALERVLVRELERCARLGHPLCLAVLDLDGFKEVNDEFGHQRGDELLVEVTSGWSRQLRTTDVLARSGGDEFVVLLPSTDAHQAESVLQRMRDATDQRFSAGLTQASPGSTLEDVLREADHACYRAKEVGGARIVVATRAVAWAEPVI